MNIQEWQEKYLESKGTSSFSKYLTEYQAKVNGRWKFVGHGVPNPERKYNVSKYKDKIYLVSPDGNSRYVIKDGSTDFTKYI
jgi:hypothetical protein